MILNAVMVPLAIIIGCLVGGGGALLLLRRRPIRAGSAVVWVCVDCYYAHEGVLDPAGWRDADRIPLLWLSGQTTYPGGHHDPGCPNVAPDGSWIGESDCDCETQTFSWAQCQGCGSTLGGSRHALTVEWEDSAH